MQQFEIIVLCKYNMHPMQVYSSKQRLAMTPFWKQMTSETRLELQSCEISFVHNTH